MGDSPRSRAQRSVSCAPTRLFFFPSDAVAAGPVWSIPYFQTLPEIVYIMTFIFSWWYRVDNKKAHYDPHLVDHKVLEVIWWGLPFVPALAVVGYGIVEWHPYLNPFHPEQARLKAEKVLSLTENVTAGNRFRKATAR